MRLKLFTTSLLIFGVVLLIGWPFMIGSRPQPIPPAGRQTVASPAERVAIETKRREMAAWTLKFALYFLVTLLTFAATAICAIVVARRARAEFAQRARDNLRELIDGTLEDHGRTQSG